MTAWCDELKEFFPDKALDFILNRATECSVLESKGNGDENKVEEKHGYSKGFVHFPPGACDAENHKAQHAEKDENGAGHSRTAHWHRAAHDDAI